MLWQQLYFATIHEGARRSAAPSSFFLQPLSSRCAVVYDDRQYHSVRNEEERELYGFHEIHRNQTFFISIAARLRRILQHMFGDGTVS
jgi:hypothetical protein